MNKTLPNSSRSLKGKWADLPKLKKLVVAGFVLILVLLLVIGFLSWINRDSKLGYDNSRMLFQGYADGVDGKLDDTVWGLPAYENDYIKMKWNKEWERGISENWENPPYEEASIDNIWNGKTPDGSGQVWDYKIKWVGECGPDGAFREDGSFCIWNEFAVEMSKSSSVTGKFWDAHAVPPGIVTDR